MLDLPDYSVLVGGLDSWSQTGEEIVEARLVAKLCGLLNVPSLHLRLPPAAQEDPTASPTGITAWQFPEWFITQDVQQEAAHVRSRRPGARDRLATGHREQRRRRLSRHPP
jgi:hypothetical protein